MKKSPIMRWEIFIFMILRQLRAELDADYTCLYSLTRDELRYTPYGFDPKEVHGEDFPGETFRVLKEKEVRLYGDAPRRTSRLVLEAWDELVK